MLISDDLVSKENNLAGAEMISSRVAIRGTKDFFHGFFRGIQVKTPNGGTQCVVVFNGQLIITDSPLSDCQQLV